jgi:hypothetical protein
MEVAHQFTRTLGILFTSIQYGATFLYTNVKPNCRFLKEWLNLQIVGVHNAHPIHHVQFFFEALLGIILFKVQSFV